MFIKKTLLLSLATIWALASSGQITTEQIETKKAPSVEVNENVDYKKYIGQEVYFPDFVQEVNFSRKQNTYFTVVDVVSGENQNAFEKSLHLTNYPNGGLGIGGPLLILKQKGSSEVNYYSLRNGINNFVLVSDFLTEKKTHEGKSYVIVNTSGNFTDVKTGVDIDFSHPLYGGTWKCDVNMVKTGSRTMDIQILVDNGEKRGKYLYPSRVEINNEEMLYIFKDSLGHVITSTNNRSIVKKIEDEVFYSSNKGICFMELGNYNAEINRSIKEAEQFTIEKNKANEITLSKERESNKIENYKKQKQLSDLKKRFGNENGTLIFNGKVKVGMTKQMCVAALGAPLSYKSTKTQNLNKEAYYYGIKQIHEILYFENDYLVKISNTLNFN